MKRGIFYWVFALLLSCGTLLFSSCGQVSIEPNVPLQEVLVEYPVDNLLAFTAAEDGTTFIVNMESDNVGEESSYKIRRYNAQGECIGLYDMGDYALIETVATDQEGGVVYFTGQGDSNALGLFAFCPAAGQVDKLCEFPFFRGIKTLVLMEDRLYILGKQKTVYSHQYTIGRYDFSAAERLVYYSLETGDLYELGFKYPINIAPGPDGKLAVLGYLESQGYCIMEYDPGQDGIEIRKTLDEFKFDQFAVGNEGESLIYTYSTNMFGLLMADYDDMDLEVEIYENVGFGYYGMVSCTNGKVYCVDGLSCHLVSFPLDAVQRQNRAIRMVSVNSPMAPYACGYAIDHKEMDWDKIVLKMLAQDRDYDLCMGCSDSSGTTAMRKSSSFYPLNDVPGIEGYLEKCYPYVREAAANENGEIWMFPFAICVRGMLVQEDLMEQAGISLHDNMTYREMADLARGLSEEGRSLISIHPEIYSPLFTGQYFLHHTAVQDTTFFECLESITELMQILPTKAVRRSYYVCVEDFFGLYASSNQNALQYDAVYSIPKGDSADKNIATCYFLAVNPSSPRLAETLAYITDLAAYLSKSDNIWHFKDVPSEPGSIEGQMYEMYRNAEIYFAIDEDVYEKLLKQTLAGTISAEEFAREIEWKLQMYQGE